MCVEVVLARKCPEYLSDVSYIVYIIKKAELIPFK